MKVIYLCTVNISLYCERKLPFEGVFPGKLSRGPKIQLIFPSFSMSLQAMHVFFVAEAVARPLGVILHRGVVGDDLFEGCAFHIVSYDVFWQNINFLLPPVNMAIAL